MSMYFIKVLEPWNYIMLISLKSLACSGGFFVTQAERIGNRVVWYIGDVVHYVYNQYIINVVGVACLKMT
jgi:hypothetical protein